MMKNNNSFLDSKDLKEMGIRCGKNCKVHSSVIILNPNKLKLGNYVRIDAYTVILNVKNVTIGSYIHIGSHVLLQASKGSIILRDYCGVSSGVKIFTSTDDYSGKHFYGPFNKKSNISNKVDIIDVKKFVIIGTNSVVVPGAKFSIGSVVGAISFANIKLDPWFVYFGMPLRKLSKRRKNFFKSEKDFKKNYLKF